MSELRNSPGLGRFAAATYKEPWSALVWDNLKVYSGQLASAGGAAAIAKTTVAPLERIKILLQTQPMSSTAASEQYTGLRDALRRIPQQEGRWALWKGNGANVVRLIPDVGLRYLLNDQLEILFSPMDGGPPTLGTHLMAGAATGILRTAVLHPFDLAHTRLAADAQPRGEARLYSGLWHCLLQTGRSEGWRALYKGVLGSSLGVLPYMVTSFTAYHEISGLLPKDKQSKNSWWFPASKVAAGAAASTLGQAVAYPIDTVRRRMQLSGSRGQAICYSGYWHCIRSMLQREGLLGFYRGLGVNCLKAAPGATVQFLAYDLLRTGVMAVTRTAV